MGSFLLKGLNRHVWHTPFFYLGKIRSIFGLVQQDAYFFLDLDGTLIRDDGPGGICKAFTIYDSWRKLRIEQKNRTWVIITNQTLFARTRTIGIFQIIRYLLGWIKVIMVLRINSILVCHHHPNAQFTKLRQQCGMRKPSGRMLLNFSAHLPSSINNARLVGDRITDVIAGNSAGILTPMLIYNLNMFNENHTESRSKPDYALFTVIPSPQDPLFLKSVSEYI